MPIFEITPNDVESLNDADLRILVGYLSEGEIAKQGHSTSAVTYGGHQNATDGGIDVRVHISVGTVGGYVPRQQTGFQVKAEDMPRADILREMRPKGALRASIVALGEAGGAYIIVSSKGTASDTALSARRNAMAEAIADRPGAMALHLDFYDRRRLASWINQHPGLVPWVRERIGNPIAGWRPFTDWSSSPDETTEAYVLDEHIRLVSGHIKEATGLDANDGISRIRSVLARPKGAVRLVGLSGIGKTRFAQALFDERVGTNALNPHIVVYTDMADEPDPVPLELLARLTDLRQRCVLLIDNCGIELHRALVRRIHSSASVVSVMTIEYDISDDEPEGTDVFRLEPASENVLKLILKRKYPELSIPEISTIVDFSDGNSRVALALANTAKHGDSLANIKDSELFRRLFRQRNEDDAPLLRAAKVCALVYSFDGETLDGGNAELPILANLAGQTVTEFHAHVAELSRRQLIQTRSKWRALLPHALAHRLAKQTLQDIPLAVIDNVITTCRVERLAKSFSKRLGYLHDSPEARGLVAKWLGKDDWLGEVEDLNAFGTSLLENIAPANPDITLQAIREAAWRLKTNSSERGVGPRVVKILRSLAYEPKHFDDATLLIAENSTPPVDSNNLSDAINIFKSLFHLILSGTHAPPDQRARLIIQLADDASPEKRSLAIHALKSMLTSRNFLSAYRFEFGAHKRDYGYYPSHRSDIETWFGEVFAVIEYLDVIPAFRTEVRDLLAREFANIVRNTGLVDALISLADKLASNGGWPEGWAGVRSAISTINDKERSDDLQKLRALSSRLEPNTLAARIASYVLPDEWSSLDVAEIDYDDPKRIEKARTAVNAVCVEIGETLANDLRELGRHLPALLGSKSHRVSVVGLGIGRVTNDPISIWNFVVPEIIRTASRDIHSNFAFGFLQGVAQRDLNIAEQLLDDALIIPGLNQSFLYLQAAISLTERGQRRLVAAAASETIPTHTFRVLSGGRICDDLGGAQLGEILLAIADREDGIEVACDIMRMRVFTREMEHQHLDEEERALGRALLARSTFKERRQNDGRHLAEIAKSCLIAPEDQSLADQLCNYLLTGIQEYRIHAWDYNDLISALAEQFPLSVLNILVEKNFNEDEIGPSIFASLREDQDYPPDYISDETLFAWAAERSEVRLALLAQIVRLWEKADGTPATQTETSAALKWRPAALRLLVEAPEPIALAKVFLERFHPSGWSGSLAAILALRVPLLEQLAVHENPGIAIWAKDSLISYQMLINRTRESEAKESRARDERFEW